MNFPQAYQKLSKIWPKKIRIPSARFASFSPIAPFIICSGFALVVICSKIKLRFLFFDCFRCWNVTIHQNQKIYWRRASNGGKKLRHYWSVRLTRRRMENSQRWSHLPLHFHKILWHLSIHTTWAGIFFSSSHLYLQRLMS